ncbi:MAG: dihydrofolate reductase [Rikenellaceae bacterium]|nr:dihydrofolate reductase [Rikenellaceae bacterium]
MISIIVAVAQNGVIGGDNRLLWHIPEDLRRFKAITTGHPVVMGRKTFESLGRPLPDRSNVIITRNPDYRAEGAAVASSLEKAVDMFPAEEEVFIIGGGEIYRQAMPLSDRLYITEVLHNYEGDTVFPVIDPALWREESSDYHPRGEKYPYPFRYVNYRRRE